MGQVYMCIDLKSFYASVECVARGYDPFKVPLVVADPTRGDGAITLAISPALKELGDLAMYIHEITGNYCKPIIKKPDEK